MMILKKTGLRRARAFVVVVLAVAAIAGCRRAATLRYEVYTSSPQGFLVNSTLIYGDREAVLVDGQFLLSEGRKVAEMIRRSGKNLKAIIVTHAHPDHYFGLNEVLASYPDTPVYATPAVARHMRELSAKKVAQWKPIIGDDLTGSPVSAQELAAPYEIELEGNTIQVVDGFAGDTHPHSIVQVPALKLAIIGDTAYDGVHLWLAERTAAERETWMESLGRIQALGPTHIVPGHQVPGRSGGPALLADNIQYIKDFSAAAENAGDAATLKAAMLEKYPDFQLEMVLDLSVAHALDIKTAE